MVANKFFWLCSRVGGEPTSFFACRSCATGLQISFFACCSAATRQPTSLLSNYTAAGSLKSGSYKVSLSKLSEYRLQQGLRTKAPFCFQSWAFAPLVHELCNMRLNKAKEEINHV
ncbi:hypothetical protein LH29_19190 [Draconibacterium sediminis]|uniref:Uncharacterized protein n=1 Tax=Draconibacterium sediminis TaxID=1544798 RepID=A0A0D8J793_9BACT|nr:hypothetical protein LH29_19190 [Draconibacterium sediminis]